MQNKMMGYFNIEVSDDGEEIKVYHRKAEGEKLLFNFKINTQQHNGKK